MIKTCFSPIPKILATVVAHYVLPIPFFFSYVPISLCFYFMPVKNITSFASPGTHYARQQPWCLFLCTDVFFLSFFLLRFIIIHVLFAVKRFFFMQLRAGVGMDGMRFFFLSFFPSRHMLK